MNCNDLPAPDAVTFLDPMANPLWMTFPALEDLSGFAHRFVLRHPLINVHDERAIVIERLRGWHLEQVTDLGFSENALCTAEQVHGTRVAVVERPSVELMGMDGLVTNVPGLVVGIYVADCCAVYFADPVSGACGVVHSGRKGSEGQIAVQAIEVMQQHYGTCPENLHVQLSPCIRPPAYEVDFAAQIRSQILAVGVPQSQLHDCNICTSSDLRRFYSYRMEKGRTGRMLALLGRRGACI